MCKAPARIALPCIVTLTMTSGRRVRAVNFTPRDSELLAGWELSLGIDSDGQHRLTWVADTEVAEVEVSA